MRKTKLILLAAFICVLVFSFMKSYVTCETASTAEPESDLYDKIELFSSAITIVQSDYVEKVEPKKLVYGALEGLLTSLDGYSQFMDPESFKEMEIDTRGEFGGLGIEIGIRDEVLTIIAPIDGTPAHEAGLKAGDRIVKIDGELTRGIKLTEAVKKLRGKPGTEVTLTVLREGEDKILDFTITRNTIKIKSIKDARILVPGIGYLKLVEFQQNTPKELKEKLKKLTTEGMEALILDLRNNPGGLLDVSYKVADIFLSKGKLVVSLKGRVPEQNKEYISSGRSPYTDFPIIVLVNQGSASASEIVAGAVQDNKRGIILGTKTFGKASVQTVIPLKDGSAVRLTTAAYYTPSGRLIRDEGIIPNVEVKLREIKVAKVDEKNVFEKVDKDESLEPEKEILDNQMQAALDMLRGIMFYKKSGEKS